MSDAAVEGTGQVSWQIDRRIPVALIVSIFMQTAAGVWWVATTNQRLTSVEEKTALVASRGDRLTRVEVKVEAANDGISEIKAMLRHEPLPTKRGDE